MDEIGCKEEREQEEVEEGREEEEESQREGRGNKREEDDGWTEGEKWKDEDSKKEEGMSREEEVDKRREERGKWREREGGERREDYNKTSSSLILPTAFLRSCLLFKKMEGVHLMEVPGMGALVGILGEESVFWQEVAEGMMLRIVEDVSDGFIFVINELCAAEQRLFDRLENKIYLTKIIT